LVEFCEGRSRAAKRKEVINKYTVPGIRNTARNTAVTANRFGSDIRPRGTLDFTGQSQLVGPEGELIYRAKSREEELVSCHLMTQAG